MVYLSMKEAEEKMEIRVSRLNEKKSEWNLILTMGINWLNYKSHFKILMEKQSQIKGKSSIRSFLMSIFILIKIGVLIFTLISFKSLEFIFS